MRALWLDRQNCSHNVSQKFKRIKRVSELNTNLFFSNFRAAPGYPSKIFGYPAQKVWFPWVSRDIPNFLAPAPSTNFLTPTPPEDIRTQKSGFGFFFPCVTNTPCVLNAFSPSLAGCKGRDAFVFQVGKVLLHTHKGNMAIQKPGNHPNFDKKTLSE